MIFVSIFLYIIILLIMAVKNTMRIWCSWCSIADFSSACTGSSPVIRYLNVYSADSKEMLGRIVLWLIIMIWGGALIYYSANLVETFWRSSWAEEKLWWTRQMRVLFWFGAVVIWGLMAMWILAFSDPTDVTTS